MQRTGELLVLKTEKYIIHNILLPEKVFSPLFNLDKAPMGPFSLNR